MPVTGTPEPGEVALREDIEKQVRAELRPQYDAERAAEYDRARWAVAISMFVGVCAGLPIAAAVLGLAVRIFFYASGL